MDLFVWLTAFVAGATALALAGLHLARAGDEIAVRTGIGGLAVGALLIAITTSIPEVLTAVSAAVADAPDIAVGGLLGSSMANMAILAIVDLSHHGRVWPRVELGHARIGAVAIGLTSMVALAQLTPDVPVVGWVGLDTILVAVAYIAAIGWVRRSPLGRSEITDLLPKPIGWSAEVPEDVSPAQAPPSARTTDPVETSFRPVTLRFVAAGAVIIVVAPLVAVSAREISEITRIEQTAVGVVLVAVSTSLPELLAALAAVRIGAHDLAVGNLLGSNAANVAVLLLVDLAYSPGRVLAAGGTGQPVAAVSAIVLMSLALAAIVHGKETALRRLEPDAVVLLLAYAATLGIVLAAHG